jgi:hypothetical protein
MAEVSETQTNIKIERQDQEAEDPVFPKELTSSVNELGVVKPHNRIAKRLTELGIDGDLFCKKILEYQCLMAGSFPLQCLLDEYYHDSDVDIFVSQPVAHLNPDDREYHMKLRAFSEFESWLYDKYRVRAKAGVYIIQDVICSRRYQINPKLCINIVLVNTHDLEKFVLTNFDFTFCQTRFDGKEMKYSPLSLKKVGHIVNRRGLKERKEYHITEAEYEKKRRNRKPYYDGEFDHEFHRVYPDPVAELARRMDKYKKRGFYISETPFIDLDTVSDYKFRTLTQEYEELSRKHKETTDELSKLKDELAKTKQKLSEKDNVLSQVKTAFTLLNKL